MSNEIANTIYAQLGGNRFSAMTGAKNLMSDGAALSFKLPRGAKDGINYVKIALDASDTYTVTFSKIGRAPAFKAETVATVEMVYADSLRTLFTARTGLYTSL